MKNPNLSTLILSPPFGRYIETNTTTSVKGTFTLEKRPGLIKQALKTIRYKDGGVINQMGFRNPGLTNPFTEEDKKHIISIALTQRSKDFPKLIWTEHDWLKFMKFFPDQHYMLEVNIGCPNAKTFDMPDYMIKIWLNLVKVLIFKIPATDAGLARLFELYFQGVRNFHISNTLPTEKGGISGPKLKQKTLRLISLCRKELPIDNYTIIAGGGIYNDLDIIDYQVLGADHFSLSTIFMKHPINAYNILKTYTNETT